MYIDIHSHNTDEDSNVLKIENVFLHDYDTRTTLFSTGIHPWHISDSIDLSFLNIAANDSNMMAIGEIGLDKNIDISFSKQEDILKKQLIIAEENRLPVVLHIVKYYNEILKLRIDGKYNEPWIIHGFNRKIDLANKLIDNGFYLSFGSAVIMCNESLEEVIRSVDLSKVFVETDENILYSAKDIYEKIARIRGVEVKELERVIEDNFKRVFTRYNG